MRLEKFSKQELKMITSSNIAVGEVILLKEEELGTNGWIINPDVVERAKVLKGTFMEAVKSS